MKRITSGGCVALLGMNGATDTAMFRAHAKHVLIPGLCEGDLVIPDHLSSHNAVGIGEIIEVAPPAGLNPVDTDTSELLVL